MLIKRKMYYFNFNYNYASFIELLCVKNVNSHLKM